LCFGQTPIEAITPWVNINNVLRATFACADTKIAKNTDDLTVFFALLGSVSAKAACKTLVKLTPYSLTRTNNIYKHKQVF